MARGRFISLEGGEGSGKTTQARRLTRRLVARGLRIVETREPGGTRFAGEVRALLLSGATEALGPDLEAVLVSRAREDHLSKVIRPALARGDWVVCDRFADSTRAYQGALSGGDTAFIEALQKVVVGDEGPQLTLVLDVPTDVAMARVAERGKSTPLARFDSGSREGFDRLRESFLDIARREPERCVVVDAAPSVDAVEAAIWEAVAGRLGVALPEPGEADDGT